MLRLITSAIDVIKVNQNLIVVRMAIILLLLFPALFYLTVYLQSLFYLLHQIMTGRIDYAHLRSVIGGQYQRKTDLVVVPVLSATGSRLNDRSLQ